MDANKILSADLLDIVFDNRNKSYGAYELRKTYSKRITRSLLFTGIFFSLVFAGMAFASNTKESHEPSITIRQVELSSIKTEEPKVEPIPEPPRQIEEPQVRTERLTNIVITPDEDVPEPPPSQTELENAIIGLEDMDGVDFDGTMEPPAFTDVKNIIQEKIAKEPEGPLEKVEIEAEYDGNWQKFLERNLNPQVPVDNDAPPGKYSVLIQFVVDVDGSISDIKVLSNPGYGLDQEAIRVIRKSKKWEPAIQNGRQVKAYRRQSITFMVSEDY